MCLFLFYLASGTEEDELKDRYEKFLVEFNKSYSNPQEKQRRFEIFKKCVSDIERHNLTCKPWQRQGINFMADVELEELANRYNPGEPTYMMCEKIDGAYVPLRPSAPSPSTLPILDIWAPTEKLFEAEVTRRIQNAHKDDENNQGLLVVSIK